MIERTDHLWIPMPDGARLGARLWLPQGADEDPAPAILEYIPYRKDDYTALRDATTIAWFTLSCSSNAASISPNSMRNPRSLTW